MSFHSLVSRLTIPRDRIPFFFLLLFLPSFPPASGMKIARKRIPLLKDTFPSMWIVETRRGSCSPKKNNSRERRFYDRGIGFSYECERRKRRGKESGETAEANSFNEIRNFIDPLVVSRFPASSTRHGERCARSRERWDQMVKKYTG